jgi:hypothetical protein
MAAENEEEVNEKENAPATEGQENARLFMTLKHVVIKAAQ